MEQRTGKGSFSSFVQACVCVYLELLEQVEVLLSQALIGPLQLRSSLVLVEGRGRVQQLILQHVVLHLIGLELLGHIHLTNLKQRHLITLSWVNI